MSLRIETDPVQSFIKAGKAYIEQPGAIGAIEFDDALVGLKSHVRTKLHDQELMGMLNKLGQMLRKHEVENVKTEFGSVLTLLEGNAD